MTMIDERLASLVKAGGRADARPEWNVRPLGALRIGGEGFAFHETTGAMFTLSATAAELVGLLRSGANREQLIDALCRRCRIARSVAARDTGRFLAMLRREGLLADHADQKPDSQDRTLTASCP